MSLVLNHVVQAQCPGCKNVLRIPASWVAEPMKCKHCGLVFQAKPPKKKKNIFKNAINAATRLGGKMKIKRKRKKKKDKGAITPMMSKPVAPPPGMPVAQPAMPGAQAAVPVAKVAGSAGITPAPVAMPVGPAGGKMVPTAAPAPFGLANGKPASYRRRRGSWAKLAFVFIFLLGVGSLVAVVHHLNPDLFKTDEDGAQVAEGNGDTKPGETKPAKAADTKPGDTKPTNNAIFKTEPKKTESTKQLFPTAVTRASLPKRTFPTTPLPDTRPLTGKDTRPIGPNDTRPITRPTGSTEPKTTVVVQDAGKGFPRRLLSIGISNYPYANPVNYGGNKDKAFDQVMRQFAEVMRIPQDQVTIISDRAPVPMPPTKTLITYSLSQFLSNSRPMDRVVVVFVGHGVERDGVAYLVPLLGDLKDTSTLIPLDDVYKMLAASPAQEKLLILDVCRFDKERGAERGAVERMTEGFEAALQKPPPSVQVLTACAAGQYSWEMDSQRIQNEGGVFLNALVKIRSDGGLLDAGDQKPDDPLPTKALEKALGRRTNPVVSAYLSKSKEEKETQTPKLFGRSPDKAVAFDPKIALPGKLMLSMDIVAKDFPGGMATAADIEPILSFPNSLPPIKQGDRASALHFAALPPFAKDKLTGYKDDGKKSEFRKAVRDAVAFLDQQYKKPAFMDSIPLIPDNQQAKTQFINNIRNIQENLAVTDMADLLRQTADLESVADDRDQETKLWQANYDYVRARLLLRKAYLLEYQQMLGKIRKDELPAFDKEKHTGFRLASKADLTEREAVADVNDSRKILDKIAKEHKGSPYELIAKQAGVTSLGLEWQPSGDVGPGMPIRKR